MRSKAFISVFASLLLWYESANCQSSISARIWGGQLSSFTNSAIVYKNAGSSLYQENKLVGILVGLSSRFNLKNQYLTAEILYSMRGQNSSYKTSKLYGSNVIDINGKQSSIEYYLDYKTHYIEIPILYTVDLMKQDETANVHIYFSSGFSAGINVVSKLKRNSFAPPSSAIPISFVNQISTETKVTQINPIIVNFIADVELEFRRKKKAKYFIYGRLNHSVTNVFESSYGRTKMVTSGFGFGMRWYLKKSIA